MALRTLESIPTLSSRQRDTRVPYKTFMQITCLEIEKARLQKEKGSFIERVKKIDSRLQAIASEEATLFQSLEQKKNGISSESPVCGTHREDGIAPTNTEETGQMVERRGARFRKGLKLRY
jgi:hypothetical protein